MKTSFRQRRSIMLTDEDLTRELKLAFDEATQDIAPTAGLGATVHRQHRAARRRAVTVRMAIPAAAACAGGAMVAGGGSTPSSHAPSAQHSISSVPVTPTSRAGVETVAYLLNVPDSAGGPFSCL